MTSLKEAIVDVEEWDVFCTGVRHRVRIDRPSSPRPRKRMCDPVTISLVDSDDDDDTGAASSSRSPPQDIRLSQNHVISHTRSSFYTELQRITQLELSSRTARWDTRPTKKRATDAIRMAADAVKSHTDLKRKDRVREIIEISSDSEPEPWPSKRQRVDSRIGSPFVADTESDHLEDIPKSEVKFSPADLDLPSPFDWHQSDSDGDDCIDFLASLDISNEANWVPLPERNKAEDLTPAHDSASNSSKPQPLPTLRVPRAKPPIDYRRIPFDWSSVGPWGALSRIYGITRFPRPFSYARRQERLFPPRSPSLYYGNGYTKLELTTRYPHLMSGCVNKIIQAQGSVVIGAVVEGGLEELDDDVDNRPPPPENRPGSLVVCHHGRVHVQPAHCNPRRTSRGSLMKYYSLNDVAFNPHNPRQFLSSGNDLVVRMWEILDNDERMSLGAIRCISFDSKPQDLVYAPDGSTLAITCYDGSVGLYPQDLFEDMIDIVFPSKTFRAGPKGSDHAAGCTLWGKGASAQLLFSSSEPKEKGDHSGFHHAFDTLKGTRAIQFDATEAGDTAALSPDGATLVLFTSGKDDVHPVRLYDVRRRDKNAYEVEELEKFKVRPLIDANQEVDNSGEVNQASFSPDGCLLSVARNDNALHIYDMRALSRGPLCRFEHHDSDAVGGGGFGIVAAHWVQGRDRTGIVSGGNDGCVRLWEPALGATNEVQGMVLGRSDFDVGHFSTGNAQDGELPLIIGDSGGGVHTYDFTNPDGIKI